MKKIGQAQFTEQLAARFFFYCWCKRKYNKRCVEEVRAFFRTSAFSELSSSVCVV